MDFETFTPGSPDELAALLSRAARDRVAVWPRGAGTAFDDGSERAPGWIVSTAGLDRILDHQPDDLTVTAEAGVTLAAVQARLAQARQHLPHRASGGGRATLGGLLATHRPGLTRLGHGPLRDRVLGMTVALSTGELAASGGRVVKNVAGYDLHRLHVGARGTLGVIAQVTLKVSPLPAGRTLLEIPLAPGQLAAAASFARALARSPLMPVAIVATAGRLLIALEDVDAGRERAVRDIASLAPSHGLPPAQRHEGAELPPDLCDPAGEVLVRAVAPAARCAELAAACARQPRWIVDLGEGQAEVGMPADADTVRALAAGVRALGGWTALVRAPAALRGSFERKRSPQMEALRAALDPAGVMCPGRLLDGVL